MALLSTGNQRKGTLCSALAVSGQTGEINADAWPHAAKLTFQTDETTNISAQFQQSLDGGTTWVNVGTAASADAMTEFTNPVGLYRADVTVTAGSATIKYQFGPFYSSD